MVSVQIQEVAVVTETTLLAETVFLNDVYLPISRLIVVWVVYFLCLNGRLDVL